MSKYISGLFRGTTNGNTSIVWNHLYATQPNYPGTELPRSFNVETPAGEMWTHGNATEHMYEAIFSLKKDPRLKDSNPELYTQFILYDYWKSLSSTVKTEIVFDRIINTGKWEFIFSKPRSNNANPVVKHAKFTGL